MVMTPVQLNAQLMTLTNASTEIDAINNLTSALYGFYINASAGGIPAIPAAMLPAKSAMALAFAGMSVPGAGAASFQAGIVAFWGAVCAAGPTVWPGTITPCTPPPGITTIAAVLTPVFVANATSMLSKPEAVAAIVTALFPLNIGGISTLPGSPPTPVPIL